MEVIEHALLRIADATGAGEARRAASGLSRRLALSESDAGRFALVVTELVTNIAKHAGDGELFLRELRNGSARGVGVLAIDRGPGIANEALRDGYSTKGTPGTGLGAIARLSTLFELYSSPGSGSALVAEVWPDGAPRTGRMRIGGVNAPYPGEDVSGDAWAVYEGADLTQVIVSDGLGHGAHAAEASRAALEAFQQHAGGAPAQMLARVHDALRHTRGAAVAIASIARERGQLCYAGVGNISATVVSRDNATHSLVSHHGTAGGVARKIQEFHHPWRATDLLVLHSDGLNTKWKLDGYPGIATRNPALVAGVLYRDHRRGRDDTTVVVVSEAV